MGGIGERYASGEAAASQLSLAKAKDACRPVSVAAGWTCSTGEGVWKAPMNGTSCETSAVSTAGSTAVNAAGSKETVAEYGMPSTVRPWSPSRPVSGDAGGDGYDDAADVYQSPGSVVYTSWV